MTALRIAGPDDLERLLPLVAAYHAHDGINSDETHLRDALTPLLEGAPHGVIYLIGPRSSAVGYIALSFGWSIELGGIDAIIDEFWIRPAVRGRGMGSEALLGLLPALGRHGLKGLSLEVDRKNEGAQRLYARLGFEMREKYSLMTRVLV